jgi:hypothetical protein
MSIKNSNDTIGNRTRDLPACSAVPQPTANLKSINDGIKGLGNIENVNRNGRKNNATLLYESKCTPHAVTEHHGVVLSIKTGFGLEFQNGDGLSSLTPVCRLQFPQQSVL